MSEPTRRIAENVDSVKARIQTAAIQSGRRPEEVRLVAVTKYVSAALTRCVCEAGCTDLAESRPQQLWGKVAELSDLPTDWHLIGHLQRNKAPRTISNLSWLHSLDSVRLIQAVDDSAIAQQRPVKALIEINVSGDETKHGFRPEEIDSAVEAVKRCQAITVQGVMGMASNTGGVDRAREDFQRLRMLRDELAGKFPDLHWDELSMGMTNDFEVAIQEGATMVRVGSALFAGIDPRDFD